MSNDENQERLREASRRVFEPRSGRRMSEEDVREITHNIRGFFEVLRTWASAETKASQDEISN